MGVTPICFAPQGHTPHSYSRHVYRFIPSSEPTPHTHTPIGSLNLLLPSTSSLFLLNYLSLLNLFFDIPLPRPSVEQERDLLQQRPYWKEFRFDLTPLPQGEAVTAAEFRIYKTLSIGQRANRTLHISVYEILRENRHRSGLLLYLLYDNTTFSFSPQPLLLWRCFFSFFFPCVGLVQFLLVFALTKWFVKCWVIGKWSPLSAKIKGNQRSLWFADSPGNPSWCC